MHLEHCRASLADLPEPPTGDPATYLLTLITEFCTEIKQYVEGSPHRNQLIQSRNKAFGDFKMAIRNSAPSFAAVVQRDGNPCPKYIG